MDSNGGVGPRRPAPNGSGVPAGIPTVDFYGDAAQWPTSALLHSERLIERSERHEWKIRPHRHNSIAQLFALAHGHGNARFDTVDVELRAPCVAIVPARCVHEFEWSRDSAGFALSIASALVNDLEAQLDAHGDVLRRAAAIDATGDAQWMAALFARIHDECIDERPIKEAALASLIRSLAVWLIRAAAPTDIAAEYTNRAARHYQRFVALVEKHHREHLGVANYADRIGITAPRLNAVCRQLTGVSALRTIHNRQLLTARRELVYTDNSIAAIADGLGFADPSYFTRFFKRQMNMTPKAYRRQSGTQPG